MHVDNLIDGFAIGFWIICVFWVGESVWDRLGMAWECVLDRVEFICDLFENRSGGSFRFFCYDHFRSRSGTVRLVLFIEVSGKLCIHFVLVHSVFILFDSIVVDYVCVLCIFCLWGQGGTVCYLHVVEWPSAGRS